MFNNSKFMFQYGAAIAVILLQFEFSMGLELRHPPDVPVRNTICGNEEYNTNIALCCDERVIFPDFIFGMDEEIEDFGCCGFKPYSLHTQICCEGEFVYEKVSC